MFPHEAAAHIKAKRPSRRGVALRNVALSRPVAAPFIFVTSCAALVGLVGAPSALAWGPLGHRASAHLAESRLTPRARALVRELLEPGESLADASTWADENSRQIRGSAGWHFVNVPVSSPRYEPGDCRPQGCVVSKIAEFRAVLNDPNAPRARRRMALRFLIHLVQDLHQPLHVADRNDRGGNDLQLRYGRYDNTNLHQVWDSGLISRAYHNETNLLRKLEDLARQADSRHWITGRVEDWADESLELGRRAYFIPGSYAILRTGDALGPAYENEHTPQAVDRLARAGIRLAFMLNEVLR
jgi:hypothetical protein